MRVLCIAEVDPTRPFPYGSDVRNNAGNNVLRTSMIRLFRPRGGRLVSLAEVRREQAADAEWARRNFDVAVFFQACLFCGIYGDAMAGLSKLIDALGIPAFVIGAGIHARFGNIGRLHAKIGDVAKRLLDSVARSGGQVAVRGEMTKAFCASLGYGDCFVGGCMSLFGGGPDFSIGGGEAVPRAHFRVAFNGQRVEDVAPALYRESGNATFFDQDQYMKLLYRMGGATDDYLRDIVSTRLVELYRRSLAGEPGLALCEDFPEWRRTLVDGGFSFSYGTRMHGNAMALLCGIPCFIRVPDERVRELVEFYRLPSTLTIPFDENEDSLYDLYRSLDWTEFNANYREKYGLLMAFLDRIAPVVDGAETVAEAPDFHPEVAPEFTREMLLRLEKALEELPRPSLLSVLRARLFGGRWRERQDEYRRRLA